MNKSKADEYFMRMAYLTSQQSKDNSTKVGAVIVDPKSSQVLSSGYNGICKGVNDELNRRNIAPHKYLYFEHAERNSIYLAARRGISIDGATMFTQGIPCCDCGRAVIQSGVKKVVVHQGWSDFFACIEGNNWVKSQAVTMEMLNEAGVEFEIFDKLLNIEALIKGKTYKV